MYVCVSYPHYTSITVYVEMTDLLREFEDPAVMDIKMGLRTYLEEELRKKDLRSVSSVCVCVCVCVCECVVCVVWWEGRAGIHV